MLTRIARNGRRTLDDVLERRLVPRFFLQLAEGRNPCFFVGTARARGRVEQTWGLGQCVGGMGTVGTNRLETLSEKREQCEMGWKEGEDVRAYDMFIERGTVLFDDDRGQRERVRLGFEEGENRYAYAGAQFRWCSGRLRGTADRLFRCLLGRLYVRRIPRRAVGPVARLMVR